MRRTRRRNRGTIPVPADEALAARKISGEGIVLDLKFWSTVLSKGERAAAVQPTLGTLSIRHGVGGKPENHLSPCVAQRLSAANVNLITIRNGPRDMTNCKVRIVML